jgi:uracil-DNA glycosylase
MNEQRHLSESGHARWYLLLKDPISGNTKKIYYQDARNFGTLKFCLSREALEKKLDSLGMDILHPSTTEDDFVKLVTSQKPELNVCKCLMDQSKLCGVGNYILAEGLYRSGVDPFASLSEINDEQQRRLFRELQAIALESCDAQGLSRPGGSYRDVEGKRGQFEFALQCYGREYCARGRPVIRETKGPHGRTIWYTEDQLFMPRILRYGSVTVADESTGQLDDVETPVLCVGTKRTHNDEPVPKMNDDKGNVQSDSKERLLAGLTDEGWKDVLSDATASPTFDALANFLADEHRKGATIFPPQQEIFSALNMCLFDKVKVVIVGQDPYHGQGQGHGLAFSVRKGVRPPPSLKNIFKEAMDDVCIEPPEHGYLEHWAQQGVLLLNAVLTVRQGKANSHAHQGWEDFTDSIIETLNEEKEGLVFLLWGNPAAKKASGVDDQRHTVIKTSHPSPLGATKTASPFLGSRCFSRANEALEKYDKSPIDWGVRG